MQEEIAAIGNVIECPISRSARERKLRKREFLGKITGNLVVLPKLLGRSSIQICSRPTTAEHLPTARTRR
jgi:hypothetical protein